MTQGSAIERTGEPISASDPTIGEVSRALVVSIIFVLITRLPVARLTPTEFDELGFLAAIEDADFPKHHTLFLAAAKAIGSLVGDAYRGFIVLDMITSAGALVAAWWWLRALVAPRTAAAAALLLGCSPLFWSYGAMAANYTAVVFVGSILLGIAWRGVRAPRTWHAYAAAVVLALGAGYRQDIGTFWLPAFLVILWQHRWLRALQAGLVFVAVNLLWFIPMLRDAGGWTLYRAASAEFAYKAGYLNSVWNLGVVDAPVRYAAKAMLALFWTLGPGLMFAPRGLIRLFRLDHGRFMVAVLAVCALPALLSHLLIHFGVPGYAFHYVPMLMGFVALGVSRVAGGGGARRCLVIAAIMAVVFLAYPTDYATTGVRGGIDLTVGRYTRKGLRLPNPMSDAPIWRTASSQELPRSHAKRRATSRSFADLFR